MAIEVEYNFSSEIIYLLFWSFVAQRRGCLILLYHPGKPEILILLINEVRTLLVFFQVKVQILIRI
jgi:hypothetical protein